MIISPKKYNRHKSLVLLSVVLMLSLALSACGRSVGGDTSRGNKDPVIILTGVAATGKAIIGNVFLKDSEGTVLGPEQIESDGSFSFNVYGLVPPYYLNAEDVSGNNLYSVAMSDGIANINPFTNLAVAAAAGVSDPSDAFDSPDIHPITQDSIAHALDELRSTFLSYLWEYDADINFITDPFSADHSGPDRLFDDLSIDIVAGIALISDSEGNELGQLIAESLQNNGSDNIYISGTGFNDPDLEHLSSLYVDVDETSLQTGRLTFAYQELLFSSTSVENITHLEDMTNITITGKGTKNGSPDFSFTAVIRDSNPDEIGIEIRNPDDSLLLEIITTRIKPGGNGFTVIIN